MRLRSRPASAWVAVLLLHGCARQPDVIELAPAEPGTLVVDFVKAGYAAHRGGLREGDVLAVATLPDLAALARRSTAGQDVRVTRRRPMPGELTIPKAEWGLEARPPLSPHDEAAHLAAREALREGRFDQAERGWADLAARRLSAGDAVGGTFFALRRGQALLRSGQLDPALAAARAALESLQGGGEPLQAWAFEAWADALGAVNDHAHADEALSSALAHIGEADLVRRAGLLQKRATTLFRRSRYEEAGGLARTALVLWEQVAPQSHACAETLVTLARVERNHSRYEPAIELLDRALRAARAADPDGPAEAAALTEHGVIAQYRGRLDEEERWQQRALDILERLGMRDLGVGRAHMGLKSVAYRRGDLATAEAHARAALEIFESESPGSIQVSWALLGVADVLIDRGDLDRAEQVIRRSLAIRTALVPGSWDHAVSLEYLAGIARARGDLEAAETSLREALSMIERMPGETFGRAIQMLNLANVVVARGRIDEARSLLARSRALHVARAPGSLEEAAGLYVLGEVEQRAGRAPEAERAYRQALAIRSRLAGGTAAEAETLYAIGVLERRGGRLAPAVGTLRLAVAALGAQGTRLGGTPEDRARFSATWAHVHKELLDLLLELRREEEAFDLLERYRVGSLAALIARRDLRLETRLQRAALHDPHPPDLAASALLLGEGTLLLSFAVLPERTVLFALAGGEARPALHVHSIPVTETELRKEIETLRDLLQSPRAPAEGRDALGRRLRRLHDELLGPVRGLVSESRRLLILADGPLHLVPFNALVSADGQHLIQDRPLARAQAITLLAAGASSPGNARVPLRLLAFGAPDHPAPHSPLNQARAEVETLGRLFASHAQVFVGQQASEARVKALAGKVPYLHFACHGVTDDRFPLDSYLALSSSGDGKTREDGRLQAWEVCEQVSLNADLAVLSACETALGQDLAGAGLLGLTYAFQFAGARSVLASLWPVSDRSTESLMRVFYERLWAGDPPAEALRRAQLALVSAPLPARSTLAGGLRSLFGRPGAADLPLDASHPYHWAAFQLVTDHP